MDRTQIEAFPKDNTTDLEAMHGSSSGDVPLAENKHANNEDTGGITKVPTDNHDEPDTRNGEDDMEGDHKHNSTVPKIVINHEARNQSKASSGLNTAEGDHDDHTVPNSKDRESIELSKKSVLAGVCGILASGTFSGLWSLKDSPAGHEMLRLTARDILHINKWPGHFFSIVLATVTFTSTLVLAVVTIWPIIKEKPFFYQALMFVAVIAFFASYASTLVAKVPKFFLCGIPSFWLVWMCGSSLVFLAILILAILSKGQPKLQSAFRKHCHSFISKKRKSINNDTKEN